MVDTKKSLEEKLREAACYGKLELIQEICLKGVDINSKNPVNGWTALHWAAYRNHYDVVLFLLNFGADKTSLTTSGDTPGFLSTRKEIQLILEGKVISKKQTSLPIIPNYLKNPPISLPDVIKAEFSNSNSSKPIHSSEKELILKIRLAGSDDPDFIEVELPHSDLTFEKLQEVCAQELNVSSIIKIRKLPNTIVRRDRDVQRFVDFQELEVLASQLL